MRQSGFVASALLHARSLHYDMIFVTALCPLLLAGGLNYARNSAPLRALGAISFPLYAVHLPILELTQANGHGVALGVALSLGVAGFLAWASYIRKSVFATKPNIAHT